MNTRRLTLYTMLIGIYSALTIALAPISFGPIQIRLSEVLVLFALFRKEFIFPLTLACFISNLIGFMMGTTLIYDIFFGTLASFLALEAVYCLRNVLNFKKPLLAMLMPALFNGLIIGLMLACLYFPKEALLTAFLTCAFEVALGEIVAVFVLGLCLYEPLKKFNEKLKFD